MRAPDWRILFVLAGTFAAGWVCATAIPVDTSDSHGERRGVIPGRAERRHVAPLPAGSAREALLRLDRAAMRGSGQDVREAEDELGAVEGDDLEWLAGRFRSADDPAHAALLARTLVLRCGLEGIEIVGAAARGDLRGVEFRVVATEALGLAPEDTRSRAADLAVEIMAGRRQPLALQNVAARIYGDLLGPEAVPALINLIRSDTVKAAVALQALHALVRPDDLPLLTSLGATATGLADQRMLLRAIGYAARGDRVRVISDLLRDPPKGLRSEAIGWALAHFAGPDDLDGLWLALRGEGNREVQNQIARAVARVGGPQALQQLVATARDPDSGVTTTALACALEETASQETLPLMKQVLGEVRTEDAARRLAGAIASAGGPHGIDLLIDFVSKGGFQGSREAAVLAIAEHGDRSHAERLSRLFASETGVRISIHLARAVLRLSPEVGQAEIIAGLQDFSGPVQRAAVAGVLEDLGGPESITPLKKALGKERDGLAQWHMARALAARGRRGLQALKTALAEDGDPKRKIAVLRGAVSTNSQSALALAIPLLTGDPDPEVRGTAARVLGRSRSPQAARPLREALKSEGDPRVRTAIEAALNDLDR